MSEQVAYIKKDGEFTLPEPEKRDKKEVYKVRVIDFDMSFGSMIVFMVKWAVAAIPAMLIILFGAAWISTFAMGLFS